jgi:hypothetical protein
MIRKLALAVVLAGTSLMFVPQATSAATVSVPGTVTSQSSIVEKAQYRYCRQWRRECADRWGWGGYRFERCLRRHGC